ncbi:transposase family protein [Streptomyces sp. NPDC000983]|uniref:helix-turn-helix domain-containing protein n=1 Tax=Streptomyces sp. NPDC000983 TaxID=3154373 RepID=UPI0033268A98
MLVYPSGLDLSSSHLRFLTARLRERRRAIGSRWRRLNAGQQALLALAHLRHDHPYAQLAAGFGIGTTTAYRYITEAVDVLAALAPSLAEAVRAASSKAFVLLDGTLLPTDRTAADRPFYSGKHKKHRMPLNIRTWTCDGCGTTHDRDVNAANNILAVGLTASVCGAGTRPQRSTPGGQSATKQKPLQREP